MTTQRRMTRPGIHDNEYMVVTCTPDRTGVEFCEFEHEAIDAARANLHPSTTSYVGKVLRQGQHAVRGNATQIALLVEVDPVLAKILRNAYGATSRDKMAVVLQAIVDDAIAKVRDMYGSGSKDDDKTHPGAESEIVPGGTCVNCGRTTHTLMQMETCRLASLSNPPADPDALVAPEPVYGSGHPVSPPTIRCHPGQRCTNWPECEHCGPARL